MTDHDQTTLDLLHERAKNRQLWRTIICLLVALSSTAFSAAYQGFARGRDIAALTAKCGPEAR